MVKLSSILIASTVVLSLITIQPVLAKTFSLADNRQPNPGNIIGRGMTKSGMDPSSASLLLVDTPLSYLTPYGPDIEFTLSYDSQEAMIPRNEAYSNFGPGWRFNWISYLSVDGSNNIKLLARDGSSEFYGISQNGSKKASYLPALNSHAHLTVEDDHSYRRIAPDGSICVYKLDDGTGRIFMSQVLDSFGNAVNLKYDSAFRLVELIDGRGKTTTFKYASEKADDISFYKVLEISDPFQRSAKFAYDKTGTHLTQCTDAIGLVSEYKYEPGSYFVSELTTPYGSTQFKNYKPKGSPEGSRGLITLFQNGQKSTVEHWAGSVRETYEWGRRALDLYPSDPEEANHSHCTITHWLTDESGSELAIPQFKKLPLENPIVFQYDGQTEKGFGGTSNLPILTTQTLQIKNPDGTTSSAEKKYVNEYNSFGKLTKAVDPIGRTLVYKYADNQIDLTEATFNRGEKTELLSRWTYNNNNNNNNKHLPTALIDNSGNRTQFEYNERGQLTKLIDPLNNVFSNKYDEKGYLTNSFSPVAGIALAFTYDQLGRRLSETDANGQKRTFSYDAADRITKIGYQDETFELIGYDKLDLVSFKNRTGKEIKRTYDSMQQISTMVDSNGRKTQYTWCACGSLLKLTDPAGNVTAWHHDLEGRLIEKKFPNNTTISYEYEPGGNRLLSKKDAQNQVTNYFFNLDDTLAQVVYSNAKNPTSSVKYSYDSALPVLTEVTNDLGSIKYSYNHCASVANGEIAKAKGCGLLSKIERSWMPNSTASYEYDELGRVANRSIDGNTNSSTVAYDALGRIISEKNTLGQFRYIYQNAAADPQKTEPHNLLAVSSIDYPNGVKVNLDYNDNALLHGIKVSRVDSNILSHFEYDYNSAGLITLLKEKVGDHLKESRFKFDDSGELIGGSMDTTGSPSSNFQYEFDLAGNRLLAKNNKGISRLSYNSMNELISAETQAVSPPNTDQNVSRISKFSFDLNGNLIFDGERKYLWDAENRLVEIRYQNGDKSQFFYSGLGECARIIDTVANKTTTKNLLWLDAKICEERNGDGSLRKQIFALGENSKEGNVYFSLDHLGSVRSVIDAKGNVIAKLNYDVYGHPEFAQTNAMPTVQYAGYFTHLASGLHLTHFRAYDSTAGRWLSRDPAGEFGVSGTPEGPINEGNSELLASNLYTYCANNSLQLVDPLGLQQQQHSNVGTNLGFGDHTGGAGFGGGHAIPQNASAGFGGNTWSPNGSLLNTAGTGSGGPPTVNNYAGNGSSAWQNGQGAPGAPQTVGSGPGYNLQPNNVIPTNMGAPAYTGQNTGGQSSHGVQGPRPIVPKTPPLADWKNKKLFCK